MAPAAAAADESVFDLGFVFDPSKEDVVKYYLPCLIAREPMHAAIRPFIHSAEVYDCEPGDLAARFRPTPKTGDWFFFTTRKFQQQRTGKAPKPKRAAGPGSWHSQGQGDADIFDDEGVKIGELKKLHYKKGRVPNGWLMDEYSRWSEGALSGGEQKVLCKIYVSPRAGPDSDARKESAAFVPAPHGEEPVAAAAAIAGNKRPAAPPVAKTPGPKRARGALVSPTSFASPRPGTPRPSSMPPTMQPGRSPAPPTPRPSPQQRAFPRSSVSRRLPFAPAPPVEQATPLTQRPGPALAARLPLPLAPPGHLLYNEDPAYQAGFTTTSYESHQIGVVTMMQHQPGPGAEAGVTTASPEDDMDYLDFMKNLEDILESNV